MYWKGRKVYCVLCGGAATADRSQVVWCQERR
uniref:Uncharacterized protein n=1 Tax=Anopheles arabiensis TaxID=7173 RepID=A0A182IF55_ANOAR